MSENNDMILEENIVELQDENGESVRFEILMIFEYAENFYVAMMPIEPMEGMEEDEVLIMRVEEKEDEEVYLPVETEEELEGAWNAFIELYYEGEDLEEEEAMVFEEEK